MNVRAEQIEKLQKELRHLLSLSEAAARSSAAAETDERAPTPSAGHAALCAGLEALAAGGTSTYEDLQRLQRTLSRQSFRGAESARRLVRRLSRRTRQDVDSVQVLLGHLKQMSTTEGSGPPVLGPGCREGHAGHKGSGA